MVRTIMVVGTLKTNPILIGEYIVSCNSCIIFPVVPFHRLN